MKLIDRVGTRYDRLTVLERAPNRSETDTNARWLCICDCGRSVVAYGQDLQRGKVRSCGCWNAERIRKHGYARKRVYNVWRQMFQRCENPRNASYVNYGARGIAVCDEWRSFDRFLADMGDRPAGYSIERRDNDLGYSKENCYWATATTQTNNRRCNRVYEYRGRKQTIAQWASEFGIKWHTLRQRLRTPGWSVEQALTTPVRPRNRIQT